MFWAIIGAFLATIGSRVLRCYGFPDTNSDRRFSAARHGGNLVSVPLSRLGRRSLHFSRVINEAVFHLDPGLGDLWQCPLPNGYALTMVDVPDHGRVYNPATQQFPGFFGEQKDAVTDVRILQVSDRYVVGGTDSRGFRQQRADDQVDSYFLLDTRAGIQRRFSNLGELAAAVQPLGLRLQLEPIRRICLRYRYSWFDALAGVLLCGPPLLGLVLLGRSILKLRRPPEPLAQRA